MVFNIGGHAEFFEYPQPPLISPREEGDDPLNVGTIEVSALDVRNGVDIQGIKWDQSSIPRDQLRRSRMTYREDSNDEEEDNDEDEEEDNDDEEEDNEEDEEEDNEEDEEEDNDDEEEEDNEEDEEEDEAEYDEMSDLSDERNEVPAQHVNFLGDYYEFFINTRKVQPKKTHVELTDMVWASTKEEVYLMNQHSVLSHWSSTTGVVTELIAMVTGGFPYAIHISTFAVKNNLWVGGGWEGELVCKRLDGEHNSFSTTMTRAKDSITTSVQIHDSGSIFVMNNDKQLREYDQQTLQLGQTYKFPSAVNKASVGPNGRMSVVCLAGSVGVVGDLSISTTPNLYLGGSLYGAAWHPDGMIFATSSLDRKCQIWDVRQYAQPMQVLNTSWMYATTLQFSADGKLLVVGERSDFVTLYSTQDGYNKAQKIDFFGGLTGFSLSPDDESLFIGVQDPRRAMSSMLVYHRKQII